MSKMSEDKVGCTTDLCCHLFFAVVVDVVTELGRGCAE